MGCDIHLHIEVKIDGEWQHYGHPNINRNYELFGKLSGVRRDVEGGYLAEVVGSFGLPEDATFLTRLDVERWDGDGHTHSVLDWEGICKLADWLDEKGQGSLQDRLAWDLEHGILGCYLFGNSFAGPLKYPKENDLGIEDVRFIFWFDN